MGVAEKRARQKEEFRREILESARELFIKDGYENFSMRKLAQKIDYSPTTIYLYFKSKDDLLLAISEEFFNCFLKELKQIRSALTDPLETLRRAGLYLVEFGIKNPDQYKLIFFTVRSVYGTHEEFLKGESMARNTYYVVSEIVEEGIRTGQLPQIDPEVVTNVLLAIAHGILALDLYSPDLLNGSGDTIARIMIDAFLKGVKR